jgi:8-oxo-dGTP pyrophosphatase MutT (NUDIX family)
MIAPTWDGLPVSPEPPYGATVVVFRPGIDGPELLLLHRAHEGPEYEGDWAWTPPAGARLPGEPIEACARRELLEEAGLDLDVAPTACGTVEWPVFVVEVPSDTSVTLDAEHDRFEWVPCPVALERCRPDRALLPLQSAVRLIQRDSVGRALKSTSSAATRPGPAPSGAA